MWNSESVPRRLLSTLGVLAIAIVVAACGDAPSSDSGARDAAAVLTPAALKTVAIKTASKGGARMSMEQTMTYPGMGTIPTKVEGIIDAKAQRGELTMTMDPSAFGATDELDADALNELDADALKQHLILDGLTMYMSSPLLAKGFPPGKKWLKLDLGELGKQAGVDMAAIVQTGSGQDPTQALQYLKAASGDIVKVGEESVRGEPTTHYKATVDFNRVAGTVAPDQRAAVSRAMKQIVRLAGTSKAPMEVWIGDDGLMRRMTTKMTMQMEDRPMTMTQRIEMYDFGTKVDVKIPRPARRSTPATSAPPSAPASAHRSPRVRRHGARPRRPTL